MRYAVNNSYEKKWIRQKKSYQLFRNMGRKRQWREDMQARFPDGTFARIEAVLRDGEDRTDFVREAVEKELKRRQEAESRLASTAARTKSYSK